MILNTINHDTPEERLVIINKVMPILLKKSLKNKPGFEFLDLELDREVFMANRKFDLANFPINRLSLKHIPRVEVLHVKLPSGFSSYGLHLIHKIYQQKIGNLLRILGDPCYKVQVGVIPTYTGQGYRLRTELMF